MSLFLQLSWFFKAHWRTYAIALLMLAGVAVLNMAVPYLVGRAIDQLLTATAATSTELDTGVYLALLLALGLAVYALRYGWRLVLFGTSYRLGNLLRARFFRRLTGLGQSFYDSHNSGDLMARATNDIDAVELAAGEGVLSGFDGLLTLVLVLMMMLTVIDWRLTLVALLPFPLMGWGFYRISNAVHQHFQQALERFSALNDQTRQTLAGIRLVKGMGRESLESAAFTAIAEKAADSNFRVARSEALYDPLIFLTLSTALLLTLGYGAWLIWQQQLSVGQLTAFTLYLGQLVWPMWAFGWLLNIVERGSAALKRVNQLLNSTDGIDDSGHRLPENADLQVSGLCFSYPGAGAVTLNNISFRLQPGQVLGLVGPTGAGKTTLVQLLMRHWPSPPGQIRMSGHNLEQLQLAAVRSAFAYVPQEPFLFSLSIADNIALARPDASQKEIEAAARNACIHDDILSFPAGYQTPVGERGITLSGGQRQRLCIARALLTEAPVLILDDALSAVDIQTERAILQRLQQPVDGHRRQPACIIISHRLSALNHADELLVLAHGEVLERGTHRQLLARDGWYQRMWTYQQMEASFLRQN